MATSETLQPKAELSGEKQQDSKRWPIFGGQLQKMKKEGQFSARKPVNLPTTQEIPKDQQMEEKKYEHC